MSRKLAICLHTNRSVSPPVRTKPGMGGFGSSGGAARAGTGPPDVQPQGSVTSPDGGLHIGTEGMAVMPFMFWSGMIDDVRIFDRVVKP